MVNPIKIPILGEETIVVENGVWLDFVAQDLITKVKKDSKSDIKFALITDTNLGKIYVDDFRDSFKRVKQDSGSNDELLIYTIAPGESSKSRDTVGTIHDWLAAEKCTRDTVVIALGGGVVGDMVGFAAATYMRGISFVQVPTTLLAMVDSSIGGKTAIDTPYGKNLVGAFWQPKRIYIDTKFLLSLPKREVINGMAEVIKTAAIWNETEFEALERDTEKIKTYLSSSNRQDPSEEITNIFKRMIVESAKVKAHVVSEDEKEGGLRNLLNFGHSIGHAMEAILAPQILHGECVGIGMVKEAELARYLGKLPAEAVARLTKCISGYGLPVSLENDILKKRSAHRKCPVDDLLSIMAVDKKNAGGKKKIVLLSGIGKTSQPKAEEVEDRDIRVILSTAVEIQRGPNQPSNVTCTPPGSKSISNRALVLAALGSGTCRIKNLLHSDDTQVMLNALTKIQAATFSWENEGQTLVINGNGGAMKACSEELYVGNAGTASRFLSAVICSASPSDVGSTVITGNERMKKRPIGPLVESLRSNGIEVAYKGNIGSLPLQVAASNGLRGGTIELAADVSSQYVSALLMVAPLAKEPVKLRLIGDKVISQQYIDMTIAMMQSFGVDVEKSNEERNTYIIPTQNYKNPTEYIIESDASSATYPLAIAAITGTACTVPSIGSVSLQGDSKFAVDVLRPMGCTVEQTKSSTTVTGPPPGELLSIPIVDMEPMTDAFLTACVLAAVAKPSESKSSTRITGIANQRVKECDRIAAMRIQLAKFGVLCKEHEDGIEIFGKGVNLQKPTEGIYCYDDHRVAMSFSVLAMIASSPTLILEKHCVGKTWPGWWDTLKQEFKADLNGKETETTIVNGLSHHQENEKSIFIIGMRGAGKTTAGKWASPILDWPFMDLDEEMEKSTAQTIPEIIQGKGWDEFRKIETQVLQKVRSEKSTRHVFSCGGGIVEIPENREILKQHVKEGGIVLLVMRDVEEIMQYLQKDKTRPAYVEDMYEVWKRRKPWYHNCSNYSYFASSPKLIGMKTDDNFEAAERERFTRYLRFITGFDTPSLSISAKSDSFFVSLTMPEFMPDHIDTIRSAAVGSDAIELRVDLLQDPGSKDGIPTTDFITKQTSLLRSATDLPLIFTIRTQSQGGKFPLNSESSAQELYLLAIRLGFSYIDLEMTWSDSLLNLITSIKHPSIKIIASHHAPQGPNELKWKNGSWIPHYNRALQYGDIIKLVGYANSTTDNFDLENFRSWAQQANPNTPLIALNMGEKGQLSRILNKYMTPVTHDALTAKAAPGQLSAKEIRIARHLQGEIPSRKLYLFGKPISASKSPVLHNALFTEIGLPHHYDRYETDDVKNLVEKIRNENFGGGSVTIPLKLNVMPLLDEVVEEAKLIGAVNTLVVSSSNHKKESKNHTKLVGYNTDWKGMVTCLKNAGAQQSITTSEGQNGLPALVIGSGGTSRAAVYALHSMNYNPIYLAGRTEANLRAVASAFPSNFNIVLLPAYSSGGTSNSGILKGKEKPVTAIATIPADRDMDPALREMVEELLGRDGSVKSKVLLEMAYKPEVTPLIELARSHGWATVPGWEALTAQGVEQFELWTGIRPKLDEAREIVANK